MALFGDADMNLSTGGEATDRGFFSKAIQSLGNYIKDKPEQFQILADTIGTNLAPNNPFRGIGTMMGQSSLANKAKIEKQNQLQQILAALTGPGKAGGNTVSVKRDQDGRLVVSTNSTVGEQDLLGDLTETKSPESQLDELQSLALGR